MAGFTGKDQAAIGKRFGQHTPRGLRAWDGVAIAAEKCGIIAPIRDDGRAKRLRGLGAENAGEFSAGMGLSGCRTSTG
jgi:hypothetical protein